MRRKPAVRALDGRNGNLHRERRGDCVRRESSRLRFAIKTPLTYFVSGIVFALGLGISGMTRPIKVIGFLDFFGSWDPSLAFVMIGAIGCLLHGVPMEPEA